jgi:hypothetical protein
VRCKILRNGETSESSEAAIRLDLFPGISDSDDPPGVSEVKAETVNGPLSQDIATFQEDAT